MTSETSDKHARRFAKTHGLAADGPGAKTFTPDQRGTETAYARFWRKRGLSVPNESPNRKYKNL
jgi:hypothetical protein